MTVHLSIIIASYNQNKKLKFLLENIKRIKSDEIEVILIDNMSNDGTQQTLNSYKKILDVLLVEPDEGIYDAWNKALTSSKGKWLTFIGTDDRFLQEGFEEIYRKSKITLNEETNFISGKALLSQSKEIIGVKYCHNDIEYQQRFIHVGSFIKKYLFDKNGAFNSTYKIAGDYDFFLRSRKDIIPLFIDNPPIVEMGENGISNTDYRIIRENYKARKENNISITRNLLASIHTIISVVIKKSTRNDFD